MLVATPGQTTTYSTLHNNSNNGSGSNNAAAVTASSTTKKSTLNSANTKASGAVKSLINNIHPTSNVITKNSINSSTLATTFNNHPNSRNDISSNKLSNPNRTATASSREIISSTVSAAKIHSLKNENSTNTTNTAVTKQQSFIQTLKDSVQKALISTTGSNGNNSIINKFSTYSKLQNNCNNLTTSIHNVTSSSNKVSTTTSLITSSNATGTHYSSSSVSAVRSKYFSCSLSTLHTIAPTVIHRHPEERQHASSTDSLQKEMCHFKPIRIAPKTPLKSGSKSRGNFLRFPKANRATKNTEFVLKTNCDVNNRKRKKKQNLMKSDDTEQENKEFLGIYKPKPSLTCLSSSLNTPNHQSAFVCLVAQMKNLVQSKRRLTPLKSALNAKNVTSSEPLIELHVRKRRPKKQQKEQKESRKTGCSRLVPNSAKIKPVSNRRVTPTTTKKKIKRTNAKSNNISKISTTSKTKENSRKKLSQDKPKTMNLVALGGKKSKEMLEGNSPMSAVVSNKSKPATVTSKITKKRKVTKDNNVGKLGVLPKASSTPLTSVKTFSLGARKSSRLYTKDMNAAKSDIFKYPKNLYYQHLNTSPNAKNIAAPRFSPPMTRARLKHLAEQGKIVAISTADTKKQKI